MKHTLSLAMIGLLLAGCDTISDTPTPKHTCNPDDVTLKVVKVAELEKAIADQKGKVVMVDVWFYGCSPCIKKFPHVVDLHAKYVDKGLQVMSLDVLPAELDYIGKVEDFLKEKCADFPNYILDDTDENISAWITKYNTLKTPATVLFDKDGNRIEIDPNADLKQVEAAIIKALK